MRVVVALGGNALLRRGEAMTAENQRRNVQTAARALVPLAREHTLVVSHGNGPQVGLLALEAAAYEEVAPYPLDVLGAESQGMIGYLLVQALTNELPGRDVVALLTEVVVDATDPAFERPTKPIGPVNATTVPVSTEVMATNMATTTTTTARRNSHGGPPAMSTAP